MNTKTPPTAVLPDILNEVFSVLTEKERQIITRRFALSGDSKSTLEEIGQEFSVTRERIRQIEKIALGKLHRTAVNTKLQEINLLGKRFIQQAGGVVSESLLISSILNEVKSSQKIDGNIIRLALFINDDLVKIKHSDTLRDGWTLSDVSLSDVKATINHGISLLKKKKDILPEARLINDTLAFFTRKGAKITPSFVVNCFKLNKQLKQTDGGWGLAEWRHINPRSIRDKALIILRQNKKPMHFVELANAIANADFDKKTVTQQAVHNELIRYDEFVLVGRGLYVLREWGYEDGTVSDVIESILEKAGKPLTKQEIIDKVLAVRKVKVGTISLNLQKNDHFKRVGRAVYELNKKKK